MKVLELPPSSTQVGHTATIEIAKLRANQWQAVGKAIPRVADLGTILKPPNHALQCPEASGRLYR